MTRKSVKSLAPKKAASPKSVKAPMGIVVKAVKNVKGTLKKAWVPEATVKSATARVRRELKDLGLLSPESRMDEVEVIYGRWDPSGFVKIMGFYSFEDNNIHIPAFFPPALLPWYKDRCITDVLRHEFGHALADKYPKFFHDKRFRKAFGDEYGRVKVAGDGDFVSPYARTFTQEDFCETFMLFLKHKGVLPKEYAYREAIRAKWEAVAAICSDIAELRKAASDVIENAVEHNADAFGMQGIDDLFEVLICAEARVDLPVVADVVTVVVLR